MLTNKIILNESETVEDIKKREEIRIEYLELQIEYLLKERHDLITWISEKSVELYAMDIHDLMFEAYGLSLKNPDGSILVFHPEKVPNSINIFKYKKDEK